MENPWKESPGFLDPDRVRDVLASLVVFLVALPLCIGLAVASGVPIERGLITGIVGGLVVGTITGSPLLVSGPAASLLVLVWDLVNRHGLDMLGPVVVVAGLLQFAAGMFGLGRWFRAVAPAVIQGMMAGIGILIVASQVHVMLDAPPRSDFLANMTAIPGVLGAALIEGRAALFIGLLTVVAIVAWKRGKPAHLALLPAELVAVVGAIATCQVFALDVLYLEVAGSLFDGLDFTGVHDLKMVFSQGLLGQAFVFAFVAGAATLLTATAVDQMQSRVQTDYGQELRAQGVGNAVAGLLGGLPMTGVIVRSSANVEAGATSRLSTLLHGLWLLVFVSLAPGFLSLIPRSALGAILVVVGCKLANPATFQLLDRRGRSELVIGLITLAGVVGLDLFSGILMGIGASILRLLFVFTRFGARVETDDSESQIVHLEGFATFLRLPELAATLDAIPAGSKVRVHLTELDYADHAALETLAATERRLEASGGSLSVEWSELDRRYQEGPNSRDEALTRRMGSMRRVIEATENLVRGAANGQPPSRLAMRPTRVHLGLPGGDLEATLGHMLGSLVEGLGAAGERARRVLAERGAAQALHLGSGVVLIHASCPDVGPLRLAVARTQHPVRLTSGSGDLLFVMLDDDDDPEGHLLALGCLAYACMAPRRLAEFRAASSQQELAALIEHGATEAEALGRADETELTGDGQLVVIEVTEGQDPQPLVRTLRRVFSSAARCRPGADAAHELLATTAHCAPTSELVLIEVSSNQLATLEAVLVQYGRATSAPPPCWRALQPARASRPPRRAA